MKKQEISQFHNSDWLVVSVILQIVPGKTLGTAKESINQTKYYKEKQQNLPPVFILQNSSYLPVLFEIWGF